MTQPKHATKVYKRFFLVCALTAIVFSFPNLGAFAFTLPSTGSITSVGSYESGKSAAGFALTFTTSLTYPASPTIDPGGILEILRGYQAYSTVEDLTRPPMTRPALIYTLSPSVPAASASATPVPLTPAPTVAGTTAHTGSGTAGGNGTITYGVETFQLNYRFAATPAVNHYLGSPVTLTVLPFAPTSPAQIETIASNSPSLPFPGTPADPAPSIEVTDYLSSQLLPGLPYYASPLVISGNVQPSDPAFRPYSFGGNPPRLWFRAKNLYPGATIKIQIYQGTPLAKGTAYTLFQNSVASMVVPTGTLLTNPPIAGFVAELGNALFHLVLTGNAPQWYTIEATQTLPAAYPVAASGPLTNPAIITQIAFLYTPNYSINTTYGVLK
jgi:hypothetical protein